MRECHIQPDWLLVYKIARETLILKLIRTGPHSDLFLYSPPARSAGYVGDLDALLPKLVPDAVGLGGDGHLQAHHQITAAPPSYYGRAGHFSKVIANLSIALPKIPCYNRQENKNAAAYGCWRTRKPAQVQYHLYNGS